MRRRRFGSKNEITAQWGANSSWEDSVHGADSVSRAKSQASEVSEADVKDYLGSLLPDSSLRRKSSLALKVSGSTARISYYLSRGDADISDEPNICISLDTRGVTPSNTGVPFEGARVLEIKYSHFDLAPEITSEMDYGTWRVDSSAHWAVAETSRDLRFGDREFLKLLGACYKHAIILCDWYSSSFDVDEDGNYLIDPRTVYPFRKRNENRRFR